MTAPKLRFDGFNSDWTLDSIGAVISNKSKKYDPEKSEMDFPCIELEHLSQQTGEILGTISAKDQKSIKNVFDENSVLFGKLRPYLRKFAKPNFQGVCSSEIWVLTSKKMQPNFLFQYVQTDGFSELTQIQAGSKMPRADWGSISNGEILFPIFEEQTKIASFLSAVDEKISQLTQKHQLLSQYKQGMMQKIFSQQIRFKADDGSEFEEWKTVRVKDIFDVTRGQVLAVSQTISVSDKEYKFPVFSSQTKQNGLMGFYKKYLFEDAITWTTDGANAGEVNFRKGKFYCTNVCGVLKSEKGYANQCIAAILNRVSRKYVSYVGNPKLMNNVMSEIPITIPSNISEQTKIANFLSTIDQKIEVTAQQIEQVKQWKKGLLQQMFV
ncbi:TPA: restriction endonuclease subunit S [Acinetobacter baumannii]|nr:restriction endonuclease subunit S [Acinetobacter baumannii]